MAYRFNQSVELKLFCTAEAVVQKMVAQLGMLQPLLVGVTGAFHHLSLHWLTLHKGVAKLGYIVTSLLSGLVQEGYCTATEQQETEGGEANSCCGVICCVELAQYWHICHACLEGSMMLTRTSVECLKYDHLAVAIQ